MANQDQPHNLSRTELRRLAGKYWLVILTVVMSGTLGMYVYLNVFCTEMYETTTRLLVKVGRENMETPATVQNGQLFSQGVRIADINSEVQILSSRELVDRVVDRLGPDRFKRVLVPPTSWHGYPKYYLKRASRQLKDAYGDFLIALGLDKRIDERSKAILAVASGIKVEPVRDSDILTLRVRTPSSALCLDVSTALLDEYMKKRASARQAPAGTKFFEAQLADVQKRLADLQKTRSAVRTEWNLSSPQEQRSLYLRELSAIETELVQNTADMERLNRQRDLTARRIKEMPEFSRKEQTEQSNPSIQSLKERISALRMERSKAASRYQPTSEVLKKMDSELADLQAALEKEDATILNSIVSEASPIRKQLDVNIEQDSVRAAGLEARNRYLRAPAAELSSRVRNIDKGLDVIETTEREYNRAQQDYLTYTKRYEEARLSEELDALRVANVSVVGSPEPPIMPIYPRKLFLMGIAIPVSLLLGIALAALLETTEDRITDSQAIRDLGDAAYLGTLNLYDLTPSAQDRQNRRTRKAFSGV